MDQLWAPWRMEYVAAEKPPAEADHCFICHGLGDTQDRPNLIAYRGRHAVVVLNRYPYNNGHLLIAPQAHKGRMDELVPDEVLEVHALLAKLIQLFDAAMKPDGYNLGVNLGRAAGAGLLGHLHWHLVPRWYGDTNFMPVLAGSKVIVQSLESLYDLVADQIRGWTP